MTTRAPAVLKRDGLLGSSLQKNIVRGILSNFRFLHKIYCPSVCLSTIMFPSSKGSNLRQSDNTKVASTSSTNKNHGNMIQDFLQRFLWICTMSAFPLVHLTLALTNLCLFLTHPANKIFPGLSYYKNTF